FLIVLRGARPGRSGAWFSTLRIFNIREDFHGQEKALRVERSRTIRPRDTPSLRDAEASHSAKSSGRRTVIALFICLNFSMGVLPHGDRGHAASATTPSSNVTPLRRLQLVIINEIRRRSGAPLHHRLRQVQVPGLPRATFRNIVGVAGQFQQTLPWVPNVMEVIGSGAVASQSPAFAVAFAHHLFGPEPDGVDAVHFPARMVQAGTVGVAEADDVVITAVNAVQEADRL